MLIALTGYANELVSNVPAKNVTTLNFSNVKRGQQLSIKDAAEVILYSENIMTDGFYTQYFDLTTLQNGSYTFELNKECEIIIKPFTVDNGNVTFSNEAQSSYFKPNASLRNNKLMVSQLVDGTDALNVEIYYKNELIHRDDIEGTTILNRIYQLSEKKKGAYTIIMKSGEKQFVKRFDI
jgi:hypothetical protein